MGNDVKNNGRAFIRKELITLDTYPFSDPCPAPEFGRLYPYNRFDGYAYESVPQQWEMIVMENPYIKLWVNPSVGGKIWGAMEKSTGKEFIYFNNSAKFRDVAMRGPWTSGGMEVNMGIIGHSPSCSSPVDYHLSENTDGSVSCFIGATDWPSRTEWRVEIRLDAAAAGFSTRSWWYNHNCVTQSYYQWNNVGIKVSGNLEYIYPGNRRIGHYGNAQSWPLDEEGRKISFYDQNDHGEYKSYHVTGSYSDFWGCYWHEDRFGLGHSSSYDDKPGKKIWIWGLSRYGMIWEDLLTDTDGQYSEVQSGRLFNQSIASSSKTPFKHRSFLPYTLDCWEEQWFPVKEIGGLTYGNQQLSFFLQENEGVQQLNICANEALNHTLKLYQNGQSLLSEQLVLQPMQNKSFEVSATVNIKDAVLWLDDSIIYNGPEINHPLSRPAETNEAYDFNSAQALCIQAREWERQRFHERAVRYYQLCLEKDPFFIEALTGLAELYFKHLKFAAALELLMTALTIDTYHGEANYLYALVNDRLEQYADAKDGFSIASQSPEYRIPSFIELAKLFLREGQLNKALTYVNKAARYHQDNMQVLSLKMIILRLKGNRDAATDLCKKVLADDPIHYLARFELSLDTNAVPGQLTASELPYETYIELAIFYFRLNLFTEALDCLSIAPDYAMVHLWKAYIAALEGFKDESDRAMVRAGLLSPDFVFPHREEDVNVLRWAVNYSNNWKFRYYLALACIQNLDTEEGLALLQSCADEPDSYPFYKVRADLKKGKDEEGRLHDLEKAAEHAPGEWRTAFDLTKYYAERKDWKKALPIAENAASIHPDNYYLGLQLAKCYMQTQNFEKAIALMQNIHVLPNEGASEGRNSWRETHLLTALSAIDKKDPEMAVYYIDEARKWPENMGIGKPYHVDERLEDYMQLICLDDADQEKKKELILRIAAYRKENPDSPYGSADFISMLLLKATGEQGAAGRIAENWQTVNPDDLALRWATACLQGNTKETEKLSLLEPPVRTALPYEILFEDRPFLFIKKLFKRGLFNPYLQSATINQSTLVSTKT
jgi:thioredoxin-like negative regulator of GroEL